MNRRAENQANRKRRLREAARKLFTEKGYERTTLREIAAEADCGLGTVYSFVRSKADLLDLISKDDLARVSEQALAHPKGDTLRDRLLYFYQAIFEHHGKNVALARVAFRELGREADRGAGDRRALLERHAEWIEEAKARGEVRAEVNAAELAVTVFGLHYFCLALWFGGAADRQSAFLRLARQVEMLERGWR